MRPLLLALLLSLVLCPNALAAEVRLSGAASMADALKDLISTYREKSDGGAVFLTNFAASGTLAKQIALGAPTDIFISAHPKWMSYLVEEELIPADRVRVLACNSLVFVGRKNPAITSLEDIADLRRIAIGSPQSVPAGQYAREILETAGLYDQMRGKLIMAKDVRQALIYADRGEVDGAFVYTSDARLAKEAFILFAVPRRFYGDVIYPVGLTREGVENSQAVAFYDFLATSEARGILKKHGFIVK